VDGVMLVIIIIITRYSVYTCDPDNRNPRAFNSWPGFTGKSVSKLDMSLIQPVLDLYKTAWCDDSDTLLHYIISLFAFYEKNRLKPTKVWEIMETPRF